MQDLNSLTGVPRLSPMIREPERAIPLYLRRATPYIDTLLIDLSWE